MKPSTVKIFVLLTVILMDLLTGMEFDLFVPSFPEIQHHFNLTPFWVEALLSGNFIGYCISLFFAGELADRYGRKSIILSGLIIFILGSLLCLCDSYNILLLGRFLQGVGIAAPAILSFLIIADAYSLKEQQFLMAMLNGSMNMAVAIAPVLGSYITLYFHWQGNFVALLLLGIFVLAMTIFFIPKSHAAQQVEAASMVSYVDIFKSKPLLLLIFSILMMFVPYWIFVGMSPLLYIKSLGVSLAHFGYYQGVLALVFSLGSVLFGFIIKRYGDNQKQLLSISNGIFIVSFLLIGFVSYIDSHNPLFITLAMLSFVIGQIIPGNLLYPICLSFMPHAKGRVSAIIQGGRLIVSSLSLQLAGYVYQGSFQNIGMIIISFIAMGLVASFFVVRNERLMCPSPTA